MTLVWVSGLVIVSTLVGLLLFRGVYYERRHISEPPWMDQAMLGGLLVGLVVGAIIVPAVVLGHFFAVSH